MSPGSAHRSAGRSTGERSRTDAGRGAILAVPAWAHIAGLSHGFCGRRGGVSRGPFAELNLSAHVGDVPEAVRENWRRVRAAAGHRVRFVTMPQVHRAPYGPVR